jgi:hypothetical protein
MVQFAVGATIHLLLEVAADSPASTLTTSNLASGARPAISPSVLVDLMVLEIAGLALTIFDLFSVPGRHGLENNPAYVQIDDQQLSSFPRSCKFLAKIPTTAGIVAEFGSCYIISALSSIAKYL